MDEKLRQERIHEVSNLSQFELAQRKALRRKEKNDKYYTPVAERPVVKREKPKSCMVGITVIDDRGEYSFMWHAPQLRGTIMPSKQNLEGYKEAIFQSLQKAFGRLE